MLDVTKDIQSLTTFRRRSGDFMKQLKKSKRPVILTVKGKAEAIVQDAEAYQRLLDIAARADVYEQSANALMTPPTAAPARRGKSLTGFASSMGSQVRDQVLRPTNNNQDLSVSHAAASRAATATEPSIGGQLRFNSVLMRTCRRSETRCGSVGLSSFPTVLA